MELPFSHKTGPQVFISGYGSEEIKPNGITVVGDIDIGSWIEKHRANMSVGGLEKLPINVSISGFTESMSGEQRKLELPIGVIPVFGRTGSGKSEFINFLSRELNVDIVRFYEPELPVLLNPHEVIRMIEAFLVDESSSVFLLDSLRFWIFRDQSKSSALKGGMNSGLFIDVTALSAVAAYYGKTIVCVINPMSDDDVVIATMAHNLEGSCAGVIQARTYGEISFVGRTHENNRTKVGYTYKPNSKPIVDSESESNSDLSMTYAGEETPEAVKRWNRIMSRKDLKND